MSKASVAMRYLSARRRHFAIRADLESWQAFRLQRIVRRAPKLYPFYADIATSLGRPLRGLEDLPVLDKPDVIRHFAELNTRGIGLDECLTAARIAERDRDFGTKLKGLSIGLSSGTSGQQTAFLTSTSERNRWAGEVLARALPQGLRQPARITLVLRAGGPLYESVDGGRISFSFVDMALPADQLVDAIMRTKPTILVAPPSVLVMAAARGITGLARVFSVAEVLDPHDEQVIVRGLGCRVEQVYQAAEGFLGISCTRGRLHLNEDLVIFEKEWVGANRFVPVVTDLFRTSQAVLRRRLGDVVVIGESCDCGRVNMVVEAIVGRSDDALWLARSGGGYGFYFPDFVRAAVLSVADVSDFRVLQCDSGVIQLAVNPAEAFESSRHALGAALERAGFIAPCIVQGEIEARDPASKLRRVRRDARVQVPD